MRLGRPHPYITELRWPPAAISMPPTNANCRGKANVEVGRLRLVVAGDDKRGDS